MLPAQWVLLPALPRTPNGKLDRRALPPPTPEPAARDVSTEPQGSVEATLARVWAQTLGVASVGREDNFFDLGGDSILSLQIVARANQAGLGLSHTVIFEHQTIAALAAAVAVSTPSATPSATPESGDVPLTPIQQWLFEQHLPNPHHWNQAVLLEPRTPLDPDRLRRAVEHVFAAHDALRLRFEPSAPGWRQWLPASAAAVPFDSVDLSAVSDRDLPAAIEAAAADWQTTLDITAGPLARVVLLSPGRDRPARLLLVVHHLAVDGLSWRILLEDLQQVYRQLGDGREIALPARTTSYKRWAERLVAHANTAALLAEQPYWRSVLECQVPTLALDHDADRRLNTEATAQVSSVWLTEDETRSLLHDAPAAYASQVNDVLLAALVAALSAWTRADVFRIDLEGHGRELVGGDVDLSRTVGWCTAIFPVVLRKPADASAGALVHEVKQQLRRVPNRGVGYGILAYLTGDGLSAVRATVPPPEISFNYMGQFQQLLSADALFSLASESVGPTHAPDGARRHLIDVRAGVYDGRLQVDWISSRRLHSAETMTAVAGSYAAALRDILADAADRGVGNARPPRTTSDLPAGASVSSDLPAAEQAYALTPLQAGMLFHTLYAPGSAAYRVQVSCTLHGPLDPAAFRLAWQLVVERHAALRTAFHAPEDAEPQQIVHRRARFELREEDWRDLTPERQADAIARAHDDDRMRPFDLAAPPLCRLALLRTGEHVHQCIWTYHHLVLDGWSAFIVLRDVFAAYAAFGCGVAWVPPPVRPFADYLIWLHQRDLAGAEAFWRRSLAGYRRAERSPAAASGDRAPRRLADAEPGRERRAHLTPAETAALREFGRRHRLTLSTLLQGIWALVLGRALGTDDVVFGVTVNGRPPDIEGADAMVGVFINTVPARVQLAGDAGVTSWLTASQRDQAERAAHEHVSLARIQEWQALSGSAPLFDSIVVFENFPPDLALTAPAGDLRLDDLRASIDEDYPLVLVVEPGTSLLVDLKADPTRYPGSTLDDMLAGVAAGLRLLPTFGEALVGQLAAALHERVETERSLGLRHRRRGNLDRLRRARYRE